MENCIPRASQGKGTLDFARTENGFPGAHGTRHLYNMMGGKVFEVDLLVLVPCDAKPEGSLKFEVPCLDWILG